jgi:hypothetical protein
MVLSWQIPVSGPDPVPSGSRNYLPGTSLAEARNIVIATLRDGETDWQSRSGTDHNVTNSTRQAYSGFLQTPNAISNERVLWTLGATVVALPIELLYFRAGMAGKGVQLSWATAAEINNDYFTIEKSQDGVTFTDLLQVDGAGNSKELLKYAATDANPYPGVTYYRLKQTDFDEKFEHSAIVAVQGSGATQAQLKVAQVSGKEAKIMYRLAETEQGILSLYDSKGVQLWSKSVCGNAAYNEQIVSLPQSVSGFYVVSLQSAGGIVMKKLIIL